MGRILLAGAGPRPARGLERLYAPGLRLDAMARAIADDGHEVQVVEISSRDAPSPELDPPTREIVPPSPRKAAAALADAVANFAPDAMVALADVAALAASRCGFEGPLFVDYYGHPMAERQAQCAVHGNDDALAKAWLYVLPALLRADAFGAISEAQRNALYGELGAAGRLNAATDGRELVRLLPTALPFDAPFCHSDRAPLRGGDLPKDARIVLFTGGYNNWLDGDMLFEAVELVLAEDPNAWFVSTGGAIPGNVEKVFRRFRQRAARSNHRSRYVFLGWVEHERLVDVCLEADVGVVCDRWTLEGRFGARTRALTWLWAGMHAVLSDPSDLTRELETEGLATVTPQGDAAAFADATLRLLKQGRLTEADAEKRRETLQAQFSPKKRFAALLDWARNPQPAPDRIDSSANGLMALQLRFLKMSRRERELEELMERLEGSRALRLWLRRQPRVAELIRRLKKR